MSEIPMPEPGGYESAAPEKKKGCCSRTVLCIGVIAIVIVAGIVFTVVLNNIGNGGNGGAEYGERDLILDYDYDPNIYPIYYYDEFSVSSSETQTSTQPDLYFQVNVDDTGSDSVSVTVHIAVYDLSQSEFESMTSSSIDDASGYLMASGDIPESEQPVDHYIDLNNYADTYTWVLWFEASSKTSTWSVDIQIMLRYNY